MRAERFLVTGAMGCLGAWTVRHLLDEEVEAVVLFDLSSDVRRHRLITSDDDMARVTLESGDITDAATVARAVAEHGVTHIVHLAALQVPFCRADPVRGAQVNVVGTVNVFEAARMHSDHVHGVAYASSAAVFGPPELYPPGPVADAAPLAPETLYGVYKQANERTASVYDRDHGVRSTGLRPCTVYGPGRDQGLTSAPTVAMLAAAARTPFTVGFSGPTTFQHAGDAARDFVAAARHAGPGAPVVNCGGHAATVEEIVTLVTAAAPEAEGLITVAGPPLPFPATYASDGIEALLGPLPYRPLEEGVPDTIARFRRLLERGLVAAPA